MRFADGQQRDLGLHAADGTSSSPNGTPFTSADVKWTFDRVIKIKGDQGIYALLSNLKSTIRERDLRGHLPPEDSPVDVARSSCATSAGYIVPKSLYPADKIRDNSQSQVGTGPYQLVKYTPGQQAVLQGELELLGPEAPRPTT